MTRRVTEEFICDYCDKAHKTEAAHDKCVLSHDIVYIGLERQEWKALFRDILYAGQYVKFDQKVMEKLFKHKIGVNRK